MNLFDAHNHLQDDRFGVPVEQLIAESRAAGVTRMVVNGSCESDWPQVLALAQKYPDLVIPSFGYHPWHIHKRTPAWEKRLREFLRQSPTAIGEIGLDRWKPDLPWEGQEEVFVRQLRIAAELNLPASIHDLKAWGPMLQILSREPRPARGFLLHSYGGPREMVQAFAKLGAYFSFPGYYARGGKDRQRETFKHVPLDRLLIETDAPDQLPPADLIAHPLSSGCNHPANLSAIYAFVARHLDLPLPALATQLSANFARLFGEKDG